MIVLALDTTGPHCSVALVRDGDVLANLSERIGRGHAERLAPMVQEALSEAGVEAADIDRLAVCRGPGSFTGLRVALAFAKGFALPRGLPVLGFDATEIAAHPTLGRLAVLVDVKRGEQGWAGYVDSRIVSDWTVAPVADVTEAIAAFSPDTLLRDPVPDMAAAARMALSADPGLHPAEPLYARGPDAKLPGGIVPSRIPADARPT